MKLTTFFIIIVAFPLATSAQFSRGSISFGGNVSYTTFNAFEKYLETYNAANQNRPGFQAAKYNPYGYGFDIETGVVLRGFYTAIRVNKSNSTSAIGSLTEGERHFEFKSLNTDLKIGFMTRKGFSTYLATGIHTYNLMTYFRYPNDMESYGSEKYISGVYHSWKLQGILGMRYEKDFKWIGFYIDVCAPLNAKNQHDGSFSNNKANAVEIAFPQDHSTFGTNSGEYLPQIYRNFRLGIGISFYPSNQKE